MREDEENKRDCCILGRWLGRWREMGGGSVFYPHPHPHPDTQQGATGKLHLAQLEMRGRNWK
jgi:hypothetical protein